MLLEAKKKKIVDVLLTPVRVHLHILQLMHEERVVCVWDEVWRRRYSREHMEMLSFQLESPHFSSIGKGRHVNSLRAVLILVSCGGKKKLTW